MAGSAKMDSLEKPPSTEGWTVVLPRRARPKKSSCKTIKAEEQKQEQPWAPQDLETDPEREAKLMQKMQTCIQKLEKSEFWLTFLNQLQTSETSDRIVNALGSETNMCMVIYGIGSIESYEPPRLQLSLAILMKREFSWIGEMEVFDPIISLTESKVLTALGCSVLSINEDGRRQALKPTLFFMPHCEAELYDNLLQANWRVDLLNHIVLFGNSFEAYEHHMSVCKDLSSAKSRKHILAAMKFSKEVGIHCSDDCFRAFNGSSWHFFSLDSEAALTNLSHD
nr:protein SENSITIVITY TO RED LIGHT REDUCED 1 [Ipomoea batatas]